MAAITLLITRSLRPFLRLFTNIWEDWTLLTFGMFGFMPLLIGVGFDEVDRLYSLRFMVALTLLMSGDVFASARWSTAPLGAALTGELLGHYLGGGTIRDR